MPHSIYVVLAVFSFISEVQVGSIDTATPKKFRGFEQGSEKRNYPYSFQMRSGFDRLRYCNILLLLLTQYCAGDKIEKNEMGWACGAYG